MPLTFLITKLLCLLTDSWFRSAILICICAIAFASTLIIGIQAGYSIMAALGMAFALSYMLQIGYLACLALMVGKTKSSSV